LLYTFCLFNSIFYVFGFVYALIQKINGGIGVGVLEFKSYFIVKLVQSSISGITGLILPLSELGKKRVNLFVLLAKGGIEK